jgi:hypothetical protein
MKNLSLKINRSGGVYWLFRYSFFFGVSLLLSWNWVASLVLALVASMAIETQDAYKKGYEDGKREALKPYQ